MQAHHHGSLLAELQHDVNIELIVKETMKANDVYVIERLVNLNFLRHLLLLIVLHHQLLRYDLARIRLTRCDIDDLVALCKASLDDDRDVQYGKSSWL